MKEEFLKEISGINNLKRVSLGRIIIGLVLVIYGVIVLSIPFDDPWTKITIAFVFFGLGLAFLLDGQSVLREYFRNKNQEHKEKIKDKNKINKEELNYSKKLANATIWLVIVTAVLVLATIISLFLSSSALRKSEQLIEMTAPFYPDLYINQSRTGESFHDFSIKNLFQVGNTSQAIVQGVELGFIYRNIGQGETGPVRFSFWDENFNYTKYIYGYQKYLQTINPLSAGEIVFEIIHPNCTETNNESRIPELKKQCREAVVDTGPVKWFLKVDCPFCKTREKCFQFYTCIINDTYTEENCTIELKDWKSFKELNNCDNLK